MKIISWIIVVVNFGSYTTVEDGLSDVRTEEQEGRSVPPTKAKPKIETINEEAIFTNNTSKLSYPRIPFSFPILLSLYLTLCRRELPTSRRKINIEAVASIDPHF